MVLSLAAGAFLIISAIRGDLVFGAAPPMENLLLVPAGPVTVLPLLLFIRGTQLIPFTCTHLIGFLFIWAALLVFSAAEGARFRHR